MSRKFLFFPLLAAILGCQSYRPLPIDWTREHAVWLEKGALTFDTLEDVARLALVGNPELNALRLKRAASEKVAAQTGWWEDPEIGGDLLFDKTQSPLSCGVLAACSGSPLFCDGVHKL